MFLSAVSAMRASALASNSAFRTQGINQARLGLANNAPQFGATGNSLDKALTLQGIQAQTNYLAAQAMQSGNATARQKDLEQRSRLQADGVLFF
ncbi:MAG: hypothetical protein AAGI66_01920 [Cyanobacteria bacterium P01_H01_bin.74]